jgi:hypothetical protein
MMAPLPTITIPALISFGITLLLVLGAVVGFFWAVVGTPVGIYKIIIRKDNSPASLRWLVKMFGGWGILILAFLIYAVFNLIKIVFFPDYFIHSFSPNPGGI